MARYTANSLLNSLKGKIWLATSALAFFICTFGLISYLIVSFIVDDTFYSVFVPFLLLAFAVMVFGWWLSNEVVSPIEKVSLLAKSLERSASASLPKTSGSAETDELLQTLHRNSQQIQKLVVLMDEVTAGNTDVALTPLQNSDRLSNSFQKLLAKITDSIDAKRDLEKMQAALRQINEEVARIRRGHLDADVKTDFPETKEIAETLKFLLNRTGELVGQVRNDSLQTQTSAVELRQLIQTVIQQDEFRVQDLNRAALTLKEIPESVQKISENLSSAVSSANQSIEKVRKGSQTAQENLNAVNSLRKKLQEAVGRIRRLDERSQEISKVAKIVEDLAHRTNMIALNASIQANEIGDQGRGFATVASEIERLAARADKTNKQISALNKSISTELGEVENSMKTTIQDAANLSTFAVETGNSMSELEKYLTQVLNLQDKLTANSREQNAETENAFQTFLDSITGTQNSVERLRESEKITLQVFSAMESLQTAAAVFKMESDPPPRENLTLGTLGEEVVNSEAERSA